jgi:hypothetical protein
VDDRPAWVEITYDLARRKSVDITLRDSYKDRKAAVLEACLKTRVSGQLLDSSLSDQEPNRYNPKRRSLRLTTDDG